MKQKLRFVFIVLFIISCKEPRLDEKIIKDDKIEVCYYRTKVIGDSHQFVEVKKGFSNIKVAKFDAFFYDPEITIIADTITIKSGPIFGLDYFEDKAFNYTIKLDRTNKVK